MYQIPMTVRSTLAQFVDEPQDQEILMLDEVKLAEWLDNQHNQLMQMEGMTDTVATVYQLLYLPVSQMEAIEQMNQETEEPNPILRGLTATQALQMAVQDHLLSESEINMLLQMLIKLEAN